MRNYSRVGGRKGKPGFRTPRSFLNKFVEVARKVSKKGFYQKAKEFGFKGYFGKKAAEDLDKKQTKKDKEKTNK